VRLRQLVLDVSLLESDLLKRPGLPGRFFMERHGSRRFTRADRAREAGT